MKLDSSAEEEIFGVEPGNKSFSTQLDSDSSETTLVFIDITRIKKLENIRKDFIANLSHELELSSYKGQFKSLVDGALDDKEIAQKFSECNIKKLRKAIISF